MTEPDQQLDISYELETWDEWLDRLDTEAQADRPDDQEGHE